MSKKCLWLSVIIANFSLTLFFVKICLKGCESLKNSIQFEFKNFIKVYNCRF